MEPIRVGLVFEEKDGILSDGQKSEGLGRCLFLLKPQLQQTVADLAEHLLQAFQLRPSCPNGLVLYMDGFVLPWFESTSILKDRDVISVRKKDSTANLLLGNNQARGLEGVQRGAAQTGALLLANEEFENETGGYQSDEPEDEPRKEGDIQDASKGEAGKDDAMHLSPQRNVTSKKRKAGQDLERSKDKKHRSEKTSKDGHKVKKQSVGKEKKVSKANKKSSKKCTAEVNDATVVTPATSSESSDKASEDEEELSEKGEKRSSRSARRKRAKRQWIREMVKIQNLSGDSKMEGIKNWKQTSGKAEAKKPKNLRQRPGKGDGQEDDGQPKDNNWRQRPGKGEVKEDGGQPKGLLHWKQSSQWDTSKDKRANRDTNMNGNVSNQARQMNGWDGEVVPVVIKPGHIRFESLGKEKDVPEARNQGPEVPQQWNGITSKKRGQKWGTEKNSFTRRTNFKANRREEPKTLVLPKDIHLDEPIDFDKYPVIDYLPKVGDVISYRIIELTSIWTPEPSSIRIGHVSWRSDKTAHLVLTQVPGHPVDIKKPDEQEPEQVPFDNPYKEDGSLETHFTGLLDVRIIKHSSEGAEEMTSQVNDTVNATTPASNEKGADDASTLASPGTGVENNGETQANCSENGEKKVDAWELLSEALNAKKDELSQEKQSWDDVKNSGKGAWSNAAVRRSTLGPTMAYLRSKNQI